MKAQEFGVYKNFETPKEDTIIHLSSLDLDAPRLTSHFTPRPRPRLTSRPSPVMVMTAVRAQRKLIGCALGIFICYFYFGILQEKITRGVYGPESERFTYTISLVFIQCLINTGVARLILLFRPPSIDHTGPLLYGGSALSYLGAMLASNHALSYVNYPTQVVGKSCKPIPVMVLGVLLAGRRYPLRKYLFILTIVCGVALFMYKDKKKLEHVYDEHHIGVGELLLLGSLMLDGVTGSLQDVMRRDHHTSPIPMMYNMNYWSSVILGVAELATGEVFEFVMFVQRFPLVLFNIITFGLTSALGQFFIFITVTSFGPLVCSIVTTTRKFFTVLASVFLFGNSLMSRQWLGAALVFTGLTLDILYGKDTPKVRVSRSMAGDDVDDAHHHQRHHHHPHHDRHHHGPHAHQHRAEHAAEREGEEREVETIVQEINK